MVGILIRLAPLGDWCKQVSRRFAPLDVVVRHHHVDNIIRTPLRHMATETVARLRVPA